MGTQKVDITMAEDNAKTPGITSWKAAVVGVASMVTPLAALSTPTQQPSAVVQPDKPKPDHGIEWEADKDRQALAKQALDSLKARGAKYTVVTEGISESLRYKGVDFLPDLKIGDSFCKRLKSQAGDVACRIDVPVMNRSTITARPLPYSKSGPTFRTAGRVNATARARLG
jgi:hypothetical protein